MRRNELKADEVKINAWRLIERELRRGRGLALYFLLRSQPRLEEIHEQYSSADL
jgi:hypothetical protein